MSKNLYTLELSGTPRERGRVHGESLRSVIREGIERWADHISDVLGKDHKSFMENILESSNYLPSINMAAPDLLEEVAGISDGSNIDFNQIFLWQLAFDESWHKVKKILRQKSQSSLCSAFGRIGKNGNPTFMAHTSDLPYYFDGCQTLLKISYPESDFQSLIFTIAGVLFQTGINNRGICVVANSLPQLDYSDTGLPGSYFLRRILESQSINDAIDFIHLNRPAIGLNVIICDPDRIVDLECSKDVIAVYSPYNSSDYICHTNHPLTNDDCDMFANKYGYDNLDPQIDDPYPSLSNKRLEYLYNQAKEGSMATIKEAKNIMGSHEIPICFCRGYSEKGFTFGGSIFELSPKPLFHLSPGPPGETPYQLFSFNN